MVQISTPPTDPPSPNVPDDDVSEQPFQQMPVSPRDASHFIDWFDIPLKWPASFMAEKTCKMICYLWFSSSVPWSQIPLPLTHTKHHRPLTLCSSIPQQHSSNSCKSCSRPPKSASLSSSFPCIIFSISRSATVLLSVSWEVSSG